MPVAEKHHTDRNQALQRWPSAVWPALLFAIVACFFWKLTLTNQYTWLENPETANQLLPSYQFQAGEWHARHIPTWDPYFAGGRPVFGQTGNGAAYPINWLLFLAPLRRGWIRQSYLNWYFVLIHCQAALFCYWLCRDLNRTRSASLLSGLAFGLGGIVGATNSPAVVNAAAWAPLVLMFFFRVTRSDRPVVSAALSGASLGMAFLSTDTQIPLLLTVMMAGLWLDYLRSRWKDLKLLLIFSVFLIDVSALHIFSMPSWPRLAGSAATLDRYLGLTVLSLAFLGAVTAWREHWVRRLAIIALIGLLYPHGSAIFLFHLGSCILIAYGLESYRLASPFTTRLTVWLLCGCSAFIGVAIWVLTVTRTPFDDRLGMVLLVGLLLAALYSAGGRLTARASTVCLGALILLELGNVTTYTYPSLEQGAPNLKKLSEDYEIAGFLRDQPGPVRVTAAAADIPYNFGDWYGIEYFPDEVGSANFRIGKTPSRPNQVEVFTARSGLKAYQDRAPQTYRAYTPYGSKRVYWGASLSVVGLLASCVMAWRTHAVR